MGRFAQADTDVPASQGVQGFDRFAYGNNNPVRYTDPTGHWICDGLECLEPTSNGNLGHRGGGGENDDNNIDPREDLEVGVFCEDGYGCWTDGLTDVGGTWHDPAVYLSLAVSGWGSGLSSSLYKTTLYACLKSPICAYLIGAQELAKLPKRIGNKGSTSGTLYAGGKQTSVESGWGGPGGQMPQGARGFNIVTRTHAEGQAAALMHQNGWHTGTLIINNTPCTSCELLLPRMLPPYSTLYLVGPGGYHSIFQGLP